MYVQIRSVAGNYFFMTVLLLISTAIVLPLQAAEVPSIRMARFNPIIELGTLGGASSNARSINNLGQVVGWSQTVDGANRAFLYDNGVMLDLGTLTGGVNSKAMAINQFGQVIGQSGINEYGDQFPEIGQATLWDNSTMRSLGALHCACTFNRRYGTSIVYAINTNGQAVGESESIRGEWVRHAFLWQDSILTDIGGGPGDWSISRAFDINDQGTVVGDFARDAGRMADYNRRAFIWRNGVRIDLGTLPNHPSSTALAINASDLVVGWSGSSDGSISRAFLCKNFNMQALGVLPGDTNSQALDVNDYGHIVGWSGNSDRSESRAFLWLRGMMIDVNTLINDANWKLIEATSINNHGQIVGTGLYNEQVLAYLLTLEPNTEVALRRSLFNTNNASKNSFGKVPGIGRNKMEFK